MMATQSSRRHHRMVSLGSLLLGLSLLGFSLLLEGWAQIRTDGSLGPQTTFTGQEIAIGHDVGQIRGDNLFHSFLDFNIATGGSVTFTGPANIDNIVSRVTGGHPSLIDGTLGSTIDGANMFFLNPSGVLFGPSAALDVKGSFHVSTADQLHFADGKTLETGQPLASGLSIAAPTAFGFLDRHPAGIAMLGGALRVERREHLSLTGGDLTIAGGALVAPHGHIRLISVASAAEVRLTGDTHSTVHDAERLGEIVLSDGAAVNTNGAGGRHGSHSSGKFSHRPRPGQCRNSRRRAGWHH